VVLRHEIYIRSLCLCIHTVLTVQLFFERAWERNILCTHKTTGHDSWNDGWKRIRNDVFTTKCMRMFKFAERWTSVGPSVRRHTGTPRRSCRRNSWNSCSCSTRGRRSYILYVPSARREDDRTSNPQHLRRLEDEYSSVECDRATKCTRRRRTRATDATGLRRRSCDGG